jgi:hypothetical protein
MALDVGQLGKAATWLRGWGLVPTGISDPLADAAQALPEFVAFARDVAQDDGTGRAAQAKQLLDKWGLA